MSTTRPTDMGEVIRFFEFDHQRAKRLATPFIAVGFLIMLWAAVLFWQGISLPSPFGIQAMGSVLVFTTCGIGMIVWGWWRGFPLRLAGSVLAEYEERFMTKGTGFIVAGVLGSLLALDARYCILGIGIVVSGMAALSVSRWGGSDAQAALFQKGFTFTRGNRTTAVFWDNVKRVDVRGSNTRAEVIIARLEGKTLYLQNGNLKDYLSLVDAIVQHTARS